MSKLLPYEPFDEKGHAVSMRQDNGGSWYHIEDVEAEFERLRDLLQECLDNPGVKIYSAAFEVKIKRVLDRPAQKG